MKPKRVAIIGADWPAYEKYCPNFTGMTDGLNAMGIENKLFSCRPNLNYEEVIKYQPDLVIYGLLDMVRNVHWRMQIRKQLPDAKIVMWYGDLRNDKTGHCSANMSEIDMMFVSNDAQSQFYKDHWRVKECHFLPLGSSIHNREFNSKYNFDFVFIGGVITGAGFMERAKQMWHYKEKGLQILDGDARRPALRAKIMKEMPQVYRSSKVVLDQSHFTNIKGYTSNRFWIVTASGGFALTKRWPGCEEFYPKGTRVYFDTFEEAIELKNYYIDHPDEREKIRLAGFEHAKNHTYDKRFDIMFSLIYAKPPNEINNARIGREHESVSSGTSINEKPLQGSHNKKSTKNIRHTKIKTVAEEKR